MDQVFHALLYVLAVGFILLILYEVYRYVKGHPAQIADLESRLEALEAKVEPVVEEEWTKLKAVLKSAYGDVVAEFSKKPSVAAAPPTSGASPPVAAAPAAPSPVASPPAPVAPALPAVPVAPAPASPVTTGAAPPVIDPNTVYYNHNTFINGPQALVVTEPLTEGPNSLDLTYTSQNAGTTAPAWVWMSENGGPWQGPMMAQAEALFPLATLAGQVAQLSVKYDTNGRMIGQLRKF